MPFPIVPLITGVLGAAGTALANQSNRSMSREQMRFQERMSNTAAQRSVADYRAANLNPALAYERSASSPSGASATMGDAVSSGLSSALATRRAIADIELIKSQIEATKAGAAKTNTEREIAQHELGIRQVSVGDEPTWRDEQLARRRAALRDMAFAGSQQPVDARRKAVDLLLQELLIPGARAEAKWAGKAGAVRPALKDILNSAFTMSRIIR